MIYGFKSFLYRGQGFQGTGGLLSLMEDIGSSGIQWTEKRKKEKKKNPVLDHLKTIYILFFYM